MGNKIEIFAELEKLIREDIRVNGYYHCGFTTAVMGREGLGLHFFLRGYTDTRGRDVMEANKPLPTWAAETSGWNQSAHDAIPFPACHYEYDPRAVASMYLTPDEVEILFS